MAELDLCNPATLRAVARRVGLAAKSDLSQNFLVDRSVVDAIVEALEPLAGADVGEIGPGIGTLTGELAARAGRVIAIDLDPKCVAATRITQRDRGNVDVRHADAMAVDIASLFDGDYVVAGNLPYHLTGALLSHIFESARPPHRGVFLVQREVAHRLAAESGDWSLATVALRSIARIEVVRDVPPQSFDPAPKVHSSVIRLHPDRRLSASERDAVIALAKRVFQMRRKTLRHGMEHALGDPLAAAAALQGAGIDPGRRPGTLDLEEWRTLAELSRGSVKVD